MTRINRLQLARRALAAPVLAGALCVALSALAVAAGEEPSATPASPAPASAPAAKQATATKLISQDALLARQATHPEQLIVLDVRSPQEFAEGHVPGAVNVPHDQLASRLTEVPKDKDLVLYCRSGRRTAIAADLLAANGYTRLSHLDGDMIAWVEKGRPVAKP